MAVTGTRIIRMTADADEYDSGQKRLIIKGIRLVAASGAAGTAVIRESDSVGAILYSMAAVASTADESTLEVPVDSGKIYLTLTGAGAEAFVYLG